MLRSRPLFPRIAPRNSSAAGGTRSPWKACAAAAGTPAESPLFFVLFFLAAFSVQSGYSTRAKKRARNAFYDWHAFKSLRVAQARTSHLPRVWIMSGS